MPAGPRLPFHAPHASLRLGPQPPLDPLRRCTRPLRRTDTPITSETLDKKILTALRHTSDKPRRTGLSLFTYQSPAPALRYISAAWPGRRGPNATYKKKIDPLAKRKFVIPDASKSVRSTTLTTRLLPTVMSHPPEGGAASPLPCKGGGLATKHMFLLCDTCNLWRR